MTENWISDRNNQCKDMMQKKQNTCTVHERERHIGHVSVSKTSLFSNMHLEIMSHIQRATSLKSHTNANQYKTTVNYSSCPFKAKPRFWPSFVAYLKQISQLSPDQT